MNWFKQLFGIGDKMETDINGLPIVRNLVPMPKVKLCKPEKDISEPVLSFVECVRSNPKRFEVESDISTWFYTSYAEPRECAAYKLWDKSTKEGWYLRGKHHYSPNFFYTTNWNTSRIYKDPSFLTLDEKEYILKEVSSIMEYRIERKNKLEEIRKDRRIRNERNRLKEIYK